MNDLNDQKRVRGAVINANGEPHMRDAKGALVPVELVKPEYQIEDDLVRKAIHYAQELADQIARFRDHTMFDISEFVALLQQEYGATKGGSKGNMTFQSFDGTMKVQVQVTDFIDFGPQLQIAKELVDECLIEWSSESPAEIRAVIQNAFNTDKAGKINRNEIFKLLKLEILDERWLRAMKAIRNAMRITGSKEYVRFYRRTTPVDQWQAISIDLAKTAPVIEGAPS